MKDQKIKGKFTAVWTRIRKSIMYFQHFYNKNLFYSLAIKYTIIVLIILKLLDKGFRGQ